MTLRTDVKSELAGLRDGSLASGEVQIDTPLHRVAVRQDSPHPKPLVLAEWLETHFPDRAEHVMSLVRQASGGSAYDSRYGVRQTGRGAYAGILSKRFANACRRHDLVRERYQKQLDCTRFEKPGEKQLGFGF